MREGPPPLRVVPGGRPDAEGASVPPVDVRAARELLAAGTGLVLVFVLMARLGPWTRELGAFQALYAVGFGFLALALARSLGRVVPRAGPIVFAVALAARLALLPVAPSLSDDVYRYVWEGRVAAHGHDPWRSGPLDPALAHHRDREVHPRINHPELAAIYPPLAVAGFAAVSAVSSTVAAMKAWVVLHDLALVLLLIAWARRRGAGAQVAIAYAWNPLVVVEYAGSGHHDPTAIVWLVAACLWAERRPTLSALALAAGVMTKLAPLVALPFLLRRWPGRARAVALVAIGGGLAGYASLTRGSDSGLGAFARVWSNNESAFAALAALAGGPLLARGIAAALLAAVVAALLVRGREAAVGTRTALQAGFLLSPVAHPWYLGWVLAFEPLRPSPPWLLLSLTAVLSYGVLAPPADPARFHLPLSWRALEYGLPLALALLLVAVRRARRTPAPGPRLR